MLDEGAALVDERDAVDELLRYGLAREGVAEVERGDRRAVGVDLDEDVDELARGRVSHALTLRSRPGCAPKPPPA